MKRMNPTGLRRNSYFVGIVSIASVIAFPVFGQDTGSLSASAVANDFRSHVRPLLKRRCFRCHNRENAESGIRLDRLDGSVPEERMRFWEVVREQIVDEAMPPEDESQPTPEERQLIADWIDRGLAMARSRNVEKNGSIRRLTVAQYRNTLRDLLGLREDLTEILPPDAVSEDGFLNNQAAMVLSPLLLEAYFDIAGQALDRCIVDVDAKPTVQNFRVQLGRSINDDPCPDKLILGANSLLLDNDDFVVTQLTPQKSFDFAPFRMRTKYRFNEGYQGNSTVRGWREYDSIYHAVYACMRGNRGYPKGLAYQTVPEGLLLRPAVPSEERFKVASTYGPMANFKVSVRELPDSGNFRVTVRAAKYRDALLLDGSTRPQPVSRSAINLRNIEKPQTISTRTGGVFQVDAILKQDLNEPQAPDASRLNEKLVGYWPFENDARSAAAKNVFDGEFAGKAKFEESPIGMAARIGAKVVIPADNTLNFGNSDFSVSAWIRPARLQTAILGLRDDASERGWQLRIADNRGSLHFIAGNTSKQTVTSRTGVIRTGQWQHIAVVIRAGECTLSVNGERVGFGKLSSALPVESNARLEIGRAWNIRDFNGQVDEVRVYQRALSNAEIQALIEPGRDSIQRLPKEGHQQLTLNFGDVDVSSKLHPAFAIVRLPPGATAFRGYYEGFTPVERIVLTPLSDDSNVARQFAKFERRSPQLAVSIGVRRDCGSTLGPVGKPEPVTSSEVVEYVFEGAIADFPTPNVQPNNVNYLAGVREIGVRSEYTDGRDMPRLLIESVEFEGPYYETWPPKTHRRIFIESDHRDDPPAYAEEIIRHFATRAFRRPITDDEASSLISIWNQAYAATGDFQRSIKDALMVVLTSPQFVFLIESSTSPEPEPLNDWELASKLSYFLWNTAPDDELVRLAESNSLRGNLEMQLERMVADDRFAQFADEFASQWLSLDKLDVLELDHERFPRLTRDIRRELRQEPTEFLRWMVQRNLPLSNLVSSDFVVANEVVAGYYELSDRIESGFAFTAIPHENPRLGGLLTQAGILAGLSNGREPNPVKRGAWFARKIIAEPPDDPPPNVPELEEDASHLSLRERLEAHRNQPGCVKCHEGIDPWGIPFEQFDASGSFDPEKAADDLLATLPDGTTVAGVNDLREHLVTNRLDQVAFSFLKHIAVYATGRSLTYNEIEFLRESAVKLRETDYRMRDLIGFVIRSHIFLEK